MSRRFRAVISDFGEFYNYELHIIGTARFEFDVYFYARISVGKLRTCKTKLYVDGYKFLCKLPNRKPVDFHAVGFLRISAGPLNFIYFFYLLSF